jgi:hypothetical protein
MHMLDLGKNKSLFFNIIKTPIIKFKNNKIDINTFLGEGKEIAKIRLIFTIAI